MKHVLFLAFAFSLAGCSKNSPTAATTTSPITGIDASSVFNQLTAHLDQAGQLPRAGTSKTEISSFVTPGSQCRYSGTYTYAISNVTADGFDETANRSYSLTSGDGCPAIPAGKTVGNETRTWASADYVASRRAELKTFFDLPSRLQHSTRVSRIGITSSSETTLSLSGNVIPALHIAIDVVGTNGAAFREVYDFATESWFLGRVSYTLIVNDHNYVEYQVTAYQP